MLLIFGKYRLSANGSGRHCTGKAEFRVKQSSTVTLVF